MSTTPSPRSCSPCVMELRSQRQTRPHPPPPGRGCAGAASSRAGHPMRRVGTAAEVAAVVVWLRSYPLSSYPLSSYR